MIDPADVVTGRLRAERRRFELFRKGVVTALDLTRSPWLATVSDGSQARQMPFIEPSIEIGDVVYWVDQPNPFAWAQNDPPPLEEYFGTSITSRGALWFTSMTGFPTVYDYDQSTSLSGLDSIRFPPHNRFNSSGQAKWSGGLCFYAYRSAVFQGNVDYINTDITGEDLDPSQHSQWDGAIAPSLQPGTDEYLNLGNGVSLRTHPNIGPNDLPGAHAHLVEPINNSVNDLNGAFWYVLRNAGQILSKNMATDVTTVPAGGTVSFPPITATSENRLILWLAHMVPDDSATAVVNDLTVDDPEPGANTPKLTDSNGNSSSYAQTGGLYMASQQTDSAREYQAEVTIDGPDARLIALSSMYVTFRQDDSPA